MKKVKCWDWLGLFIGAAAIIVGIVILIQSLNINSYGGTYGNWSVEYGADFYTDVAQHLRSVNNSVENIYRYISVLAYIFGIAFIFSGLLVVCHYGKQIALSKNTDNKQAVEVKSEIADNENSNENNGENNAESVEIESTSLNDFLN